MLTLAKRPEREVRRRAAIAPVQVRLPAVAETAEQAVALASRRAEAEAERPDLAGTGNAGAAGSAATTGNGGTGDSGNTPSGANGTQWDAAHGSGGGGNGGNKAVGVNGGLFGAGGGGGGYVGPGVGRHGGKGADGLIVITYAP